MIASGKVLFVALPRRLKTTELWTVWTIWTLWTTADTVHLVHLYRTEGPHFPVWVVLRSCVRRLYLPSLTISARPSKATPDGIGDDVGLRLVE
jgi:hypothetical protein